MEKYKAGTSHHRIDCQCHFCKIKRHEIFGENSSMYGKKHSEETKLKMGLTKLKTTPIGTIVISSNGYNLIKLGNKNWIPYYHYLIEKYIGYKLKKGWIIHHIDGNQLNDKLFNLYIFINRRQHSYFESLIKDNIINRFSIKSNLKLFRKNVRIN